MKKVLLSTSALVLSAGVAFADAHAGVSVSGGAGIWVSDSGAAGSDIQINNEISIDFAASGETDGGLGFGFDYTLLDATSAHGHSSFFTGSSEDGGGAAAVDNWEVYISGSWGKLVVGDPDDALQSVAGLSDIGYDGLGLDNVAETNRGVGASSGVLYSNTLGMATVYLSMNKDTGVDDMAAGVKFTTGAVTVGLGYEDAASVGETVTALDVSGSFGALGFDVYYDDADLGGNHYGTILSYDAGMATINFGFADGDSVTDAAMGIGFSTDLGGGAELAGGVVDNGTNTAWDLGIGMSF